MLMIILAITRVDLKETHMIILAFTRVDLKKHKKYRKYLNIMTKDKP